MDEVTRLTRFGFFLGTGTMGVISGLGIGSKQPNSLALLVGLGSLVYANYLNQVVQFRPGVGEQLQQGFQQAASQIPSLPRGPGSAPPPQAQFTYSRGL